MSLEKRSEIAREKAREFVYAVLVGIFEQKVSPEEIDRVAERVLKALSPFYTK